MRAAAGWGGIASRAYGIVTDAGGGGSAGGYWQRTPAAWPGSIHHEIVPVAGLGHHSDKEPRLDDARVVGEIGRS